MTRGRTTRGRSRVARERHIQLASPRKLLATEDHGEGVAVEARDIGATGEHWVEPFLEANRAALARLRITPSVEASRGLRVRLTPSARIGAVPLVSPTTRRVSAGLLVRPRFRWPALGSVLGAVGFETEPALGGGPLVPGSAREVPSWLVAGAVLRRLEGLLSHRRREFVERTEYLSHPRGRVDWTMWASRDVPRGRWARLLCHFSEPEDDPLLLANVRWTLSRLEHALTSHLATTVGRGLHDRVRGLQLEVGPGVSVRPESRDAPTLNAWVSEAVEAMDWVREERGLGGERNLDGLAWDLPVDRLWEQWVRRFAFDLAPQLGLAPVRTSTRRGLTWNTGITSMGSLVPDCILQRHDRSVLIDAKYKPHLDELARRGWSGLSDSMRDAHRADLHQALAYANVTAAQTVDSVLVYPSVRSTAPSASATVPVGRARLRVHLLALPFGFPGPSARAASVEQWIGRLAV